MANIDEPMFDKEYQTGTETTSISQKSLSTQIIETEMQVEAEKYGMNKPVRKIRRAKIIYDQS